MKAERTVGAAQEGGRENEEAEEEAKEKEARQGYARGALSQTADTCLGKPARL